MTKFYLTIEIEQKQNNRNKLRNKEIERKREGKRRDEKS